MIRSWLLELAARRLRARGQRPGADSRAGWPTPARAAGRWPRRSTTTCPRRSSRSQPAAALPQPSRAGHLHRSASWPRCATSSAATRSRPADDREPMRRPPTTAASPPRGPPPTCRSCTADRRGGAGASANPLREGLRLERMPEPCTMVICGATGDLTERKLAPALYNLMLGGFLPPEFTVVGFARRELTDEQFRDAPAARASTSTAATGPSRRRSGSRSRSGIEYHARRLRRPGGLRRAREAPRPDRSRPRDGGQPALLPGGAADACTPRSSSSSATPGLAATGERRSTRRQAWLVARHRREAVRLRPRIARER